MGQGDPSTMDDSQRYLLRLNRILQETSFFFFCVLRWRLHPFPLSPGDYRSTASLDWLGSCNRGSRGFDKIVIVIVLAPEDIYIRSTKSQSVCVLAIRTAFFHQGIC